MLITMKRSPTNKFKVIASCKIKELPTMAIIGIRNVNDPTLLASPEPTSMKKASQPNAMTKVEIKSKFIMKGKLHSILDQLSMFEPTLIKNVSSST